MVEGELDAALMRPRYGRRSQASSGGADGPVGVTGHRHGHRSRSLMGTFGRTEIAVPRARLDGPDGQTTEWKSKMLRAYQRRTLAADALIASTYLAGTNTRRVRRALAALFGGAVGKDTVSRVWRKVKADWEAWNARSLAEEPIVRLILDGTMVPSRISRTIGSSASERAFQASQSAFTFRHTRLTVSLPTAPPNSAASARRTRRVLVPARYVLAISASAASVRR